MRIICVDCKNDFGPKCPHCGETRLKPSAQTNGSFKCQRCRNTFPEDGRNTGSLCEPCLNNRLARLRSEVGRNPRGADKSTGAGLVPDRPDARNNLERKHGLANNSVLVRS